MYYAFFGLRQPPFRITPDTEFFFEGGNRGAILEALIYAIRSGEGIVKVTGEVGSGKTMLCRVLQNRLGPGVDIVYLANPNVSPEEIVYAIAFELQLPVDRNASRIEVMHVLQQFLVQRHAQRRQVVVFVEESQGMPIPTLEEIRLLSNLETERHKLLQIVLFGQPELDGNLRQSSIRQLRERITHSFRLPPLSPEEIREYLAFRLTAAGYRGPELFPKRVIEHIAHASAGLTRRVNILADKTLLAAFAENTHTVTLKHLRTALRDTEFGEGRQAPARPRAWGWWVVGGALLAAAVAFAGWRLAGPGRSAAWVPWGTTATQVVPRDATGRPAGHASPTVAAAQDAPRAAMGGAAAEGAGTSHALPRPTPGSDDVRGRSEGAEDEGSRAVPSAHAPGGGGTASAAVGVHPPDELERLLLLGEHWLAAQDAETYTIQFQPAVEVQDLNRSLNSLSKLIDSDQVFVYRTRASTKPAVALAYGVYPSRGGALDAIGRLPPGLSQHDPAPRTIRAIRAERLGVHAGVAHR